MEDYFFHKPWLFSCWLSNSNTNKNEKQAKTQKQISQTLVFMLERRLGKVDRRRLWWAEDAYIYVYMYVYMYMYMYVYMYFHIIVVRGWAETQFHMMTGNLSCPRLSDQVVCIFRICVLTCWRAQSWEWESRGRMGVAGCNWFNVKTNAFRGRK